MYASDEPLQVICSTCCIKKLPPWQGPHAAHFSSGEDVNQSLPAVRLVCRQPCPVASWGPAREAFIKRRDYRSRYERCVLELLAVPQLGALLPNRCIEASTCGSQNLKAAYCACGNGSPSPARWKCALSRRREGLFGPSFSQQTYKLVSIWAKNVCDLPFASRLRSRCEVRRMCNTRFHEL